MEISDADKAHVLQVAREAAQRAAADEEEAAREAEQALRDLEAK